MNLIYVCLGSVWLYLVIGLLIGATRKYNKDATNFEIILYIAFFTLFWLPKLIFKKYL